MIVRCRRCHEILAWTYLGWVGAGAMTTCYAKPYPALGSRDYWYPHEPEEVPQAWIFA